MPLYEDMEEDGREYAAELRWEFLLTLRDEDGNWLYEPDEEDEPGETDEE
jgi:hypothetical protein